MSDAEEVRRLNRRTVEIEQNPHDLTNGEPAWKELESLLSDDFTIIRSTAVVQNRQEMINQVTTGNNPFLSREVSEDDGPDNPRFFENRALLKSLVTTTERGEGGETIQKTFRNIKAFVKGDERWQCVAWLVFREPWD